MQKIENPLSESTFDQIDNKPTINLASIAGSESINSLRDEFMDFTLSPIEHSVGETYKSATGDQKLKAGMFWLKVGRIMTLDGQQRFPLSNGGNCLARLYSFKRISSNFVRMNNA